MIEKSRVRLYTSPRSSAHLLLTSRDFYIKSQDRILEFSFWIFGIGIIILGCFWVGKWVRSRTDKIDFLDIEAFDSWKEVSNTNLSQSNYQHRSSNLKENLDATGALGFGLEEDLEERYTEESDEFGVQELRYQNLSVDFGDLIRISQDSSIVKKRFTQEPIVKRKT